MIKCTEKKRNFLEEVDRDDHNLTISNKEFLRTRDREISRHMHELPGKLDHAAVVAFEVGYFPADFFKTESGAHANKHRHSKVNSIFSGIKNSIDSGRRASVGDEEMLDEYTLTSEDRMDSYTELYSLFGN